MTINDLVPCYATTLFMRGVEYAAQDGPLSRVQMLAKLHDRITELKQPELIPYLGALTLHVLEQFSTTRDHWEEPNAILPHVITSIDDEQFPMAHEIFNAWRECCPRGYVLLPRPVYDVLIQLQTDSWTHEIQGFCSTRFSKQHLEVAAR